MHRKRLIGFCTLGVLALGATPASAGQSMEVAGPGEARVLLDVVDVPLSVVRKSADPIIDEGIDGVGHLMVDPDAENMSLTIGVKVDPLGVDETITLGGGGGGEEEPSVPVDQTDEAEQAEQVQQVERIEQVKQKAAAQAVADAQAAPAFSTPRSGESITGEVTLGSGVTQSVRPPVAKPAAGNAASGALPDSSSSNAWMQLMGVLVLAGTATAWRVAQQQGLA